MFDKQAYALLAYSQFINILLLLIIIFSLGLHVAAEGDDRGDGKGRVEKEMKGQKYRKGLADREYQLE